ncbi:MAG: MotA/TolQ/ExbB proton channel family protein [candidate division Zixibacteria bacterium]|nr:MotA/TolQ/ExbB proton channel family protein [candidate division Zixibacteria bacterium]MDH3937358.1 MotA/TolQ/ExbB proton channel family protein [candidate division Zixibacteria bacterium]MDH4034372.1 MotA/TolQ/ExbB proton channel family protein [candidate division Zixibacteria bacterium]
MLLTQIIRIKSRGVFWIALAGLVIGGTSLGWAQSVDTTICIKKPVAIRSDTAQGTDVDIRVRWQVECDTLRLPPQTFDEFRVWCSEDALFDGVTVQSQRITDDSVIVFYGKDSTASYYFKVVGYRGGEEITTSEIMPFSLVRAGEGVYYRTLGYWFLWLLDHIGLIDEDGRKKAWVKSSPTGWAAFELIAIFFVIGSIVWISRTWLALRSTKVFLVNKRIGGRNEVDVVLREQEVESLRPDQKNTLAQLIKDRLTRGSFKGLWGRLISVALWEFTVRRRVTQKRFRCVPTVRILLSSATALRTSKEIEDAIEVRVQAEEEELRKRSFIDILWALGVTAPLVGLFGTVTGISESFKIIGKREVQESGFMEALASGINEALYTTICGLIVGIAFMLAYYWYNYKLERIHAMWVIFASEFIDQLKHQVGNSKADKNEPA